MITSARSRVFTLVFPALVAMAAAACEDDEGSKAAADAAVVVDSGSSGSDAGDSGADAAPPVTAATTCSLVKKGEVLTVPAGRDVVCALDIGSNNAKLVVLSLEKGKPDTLKDERQCRNQLRLGNQTAPDATNANGRPLPQKNLEDLILVVKQFQEICQGDKGMLLGA